MLTTRGAAAVLRRARLVVLPVPDSDYQPGRSMIW
jgi:hypothetical protein